MRGALLGRCLGVEPSDADFQRLGKGFGFVVHDVTGAILDARYGRPVHHDTTAGEASGEVILRHWGSHLQPGFAHAKADDVARGIFSGLFQSRASCTRKFLPMPSSLGVCDAHEMSRDPFMTILSQLLS